MTESRAGPPSAARGPRRANPSPMPAGDVISVTLPWPDSRLSPNSREHWASLMRAKRDAKGTGFWRTKAALGVDGKPAAKLLDVQITFHPPDKRRRDMDNMVASLKAYQDGIARAIGIDDQYWRCSYAVGEVVKHGQVVVEMRERDDSAA